MGIQLDEEVEGFARQARWLALGIPVGYLLATIGALWAGTRAFLGSPSGPERLVLLAAFVLLAAVVIGGGVAHLLATVDLKATTRFRTDADRATVLETFQAAVNPATALDAVLADEVVVGVDGEAAAEFRADRGRPVPVFVTPREDGATVQVGADDDDRRFRYEVFVEDHDGGTAVRVETRVESMRAVQYLSLRLSWSAQKRVYDHYGYRPIGRAVDTSLGLRSFG